MVTVAAQASATLPATAVTHPIAHTMAARKVARKRPAARQCELCGGNHTLSQCRLPGAVKYRCLSMKAMKQSEGNGRYDTGRGLYGSAHLCLDVLTLNSRFWMS